MLRASLLVTATMLLCALAPEWGSAQASQPAADAHASAPVISAARVQGSISVDGRLDEIGWSHAPPFTEFTQTDPVEGAPATERTEVRILYDDAALYIGAILYDSAVVQRRLGRRDAYFGDSDWFTASLDSYHDHRTAYQFRINPAGVRGDEVQSGGFLGDASWDPVWEGSATVTDSGWVAELRIPFSQLRFSREQIQTWGIQLERSISRTQERAVFAFTPKSEFGGIARYGHLVGLGGVKPGRRLEVLPYTVARAEYINVTPGDPFQSESDYIARAGMDLKYRVASNLTLDATINPDFGQVELDPAVVNLTAFETFYEEKRPFFVEGAEIFNFGEGSSLGGDQLLYSRRIGRAPQVWPQEAVNADLPEATPILGAAKLTGKSAGGWSIGLLDAVTSPARARYVDVLGNEDRAPVEPLSNYFTARLRRDLRDGQSAIGGILTAVNRDLGDEFLASQLRSAAYAGGVDFKHQWGNRAWLLNGYVISSYIAGEAGVIEAAQRSSARYFQRPDAAYLAVDSTASSLSGYTANLELTRQAGRHWRGGMKLRAVSPGYEVNDLGFQSLVDRIEGNANLRYVENRPGKRFRNWSVSGGPRASWNYGGNLLENGATVSASGQLLNYWSGSLSIGRYLSALDDRLTRGGPLALSPGSRSISANVRSDPRKQLTGLGFVNYRQDEVGGRSYSGSIILRVRPAANWDISVGPTFSGHHAVAQYITTVADSFATHTYGRRYVFSELDQTTFGVETRLNVTFTPQLSLELYAQPFLSSGNFQGLKELSAPRTLEFARYGSEVGTLQRDTLGIYVIDPDGAGPARTFRLSDRNFNFRSLRGNAVLRWEWRAGSTLFLVWQQRRTEYLGAFNVDASYRELGRFDLRRDSRDLLGIKPDNIFLVKINYWLNP